MKFRDLYSQDDIVKTKPREFKKFFDADKKHMFTVLAVEERRFENKNGKEILAFNFKLKDEEDKTRFIFAPVYFYGRDGNMVPARDFKVLLHTFLGRDAVEAIKNNEDIIEVFKAAIPEKIIGYRIRIKFFPPENNYQKIAFADLFQPEEILDEEAF